MRVALLTDIDIVAPSRTVLVGREIKLRVRGRADESPFTFGTSRVAYHWSVSKPNILALRAPDPEYVNGEEFSAVLAAKQSGKCRVTVRVEAWPEGFPPSNHTSSIWFSVSAPLRLLSPNSLLLWPGATSTISTNLDSSAKLAYSQTVIAPSGWSVDLVSIQEGGRIQAGTVPGRALLTVVNEDQEQSVSILVEIKDVAHMSMVGATTLIVGTTSTLSLELRDSFGRRFDGDSLSAGMLSNKAGTFFVRRGEQNNTFEVKALHEGEAIFKFWFPATPPDTVTVSEEMAQALLERHTAITPVVSNSDAAEVYEAHTQLADYVRLQAVHPILPEGDLEVHVGGEVQLKSESHRSSWFSSDDSIVSINELTGVLKALRVGEATVHHHGVQVSAKRIRVTKVHGLELNTSAHDFVAPGNDYHFPLHFRGASGNLLSSADIQHNLFISCELLPRRSEAVFVSVTARYDTAGTYHACVITLSEIGGAGNIGEAAFPTITHISLVATVRDKRGTYIFSQHFNDSIAFVPSMQLRVRYPDSSNAASAASTEDLLSQVVRGAAPEGCIELQRDHHKSAILDLYIRSNFHAAPEVANFNSELDLKSLGQRILDSGWTRFSYLVSVSAELLNGDDHVDPFLEKVVEFSDRTTQMKKQVCVSYNQRHEHQWYCALSAEGLDKKEVDPTVLVFTRRMCGRCPPRPATARALHGESDTRHRVARCCKPRAGIHCTVDETADHPGRCNAMERPANRCGMENHAAGGRSRKKDIFDDMTDSELSAKILVPALILLATVFCCQRNAYDIVGTALRRFCFPKSVNQSNRLAHYAENAPPLPGSRRDRILHQQLPENQQDGFARRQTFQEPVMSPVASRDDDMDQIFPLGRL